MNTQLARQRGNALLLSVIVILALALMMLGAQIPRDEFLRRYAMYERHGIIARQYALSALEQGTRMTWMPTSLWRCQTTALPAQLCVRLSARNGMILMRARSAPFVFGPQITLFRYFVFPTEEQQGVIRPLARSWIDYCPEPQEALCR